MGVNNFLPKHKLPQIRQQIPGKAYIPPNLSSSTIRREGGGGGVVRIKVSRECERESLETITNTKLGLQQLCKGNIILPLAEP